MKWLIINTDYPSFLDTLNAAHPQLEHSSYEELLRVLDESLFATSDFYSVNLRALGHEAQELHFNHDHLQRAWAREHGPPMSMIGRSGERVR